MQFTKKQKEYILNANNRWNFKIGAVRSGKTFVDIAYMIPHRLRAVKDKTGLNVILGVSRESIERNVLEPMREIYTSELIGTINGRNYAKICGQDVYCLGAEKISQVAKIQGMSIKYCYGDEVAKWNKDVFIMLESRLDKTYSCFDGSCNPESPNHWLKNFLDKPDLNAYIQPYVIDDNSFLPPFFIDNLKQEYAGTVYYDRYILGKWALAEGLIYPMYIDAIAEPPQDKRPLEYCLSIDYGTQNAFAGLLWARYDDGVWYAIKEYYYSGRDTGIQKTDEEYCKDLNSFIPVDRIKTIIDPSAASMIAALRKEGYYKVVHANNEVNDGIRETASCMKKGKIKFSPSLKNWKNEVQGYVWDPEEDKPIKILDHLMDAMRYFVKTMHIIKDKTEYKPLWN
mgnify:CR=1 FL=1